MQREICNARICNVALIRRFRLAKAGVSSSLMANISEALHKFNETLGKLSVSAPLAAVAELKPG
jgi:hypothetical protein